MSVEFISPSWSTYHKLAQKLATQVLESGKSIAEIIAISRGGLTLGHLLSDLLRIPISTISIQSYTDVQAQGEITITGKLQKPIKDKSILLVDDVSDTGKTLVRAISYLKKSRPVSISTATLYYKPHSIYKPDFFAAKTSKWILFPYEPTEMIKLLIKKLDKQKKSREEIRRYLSSLHYTESQIEFVYRFHLS